MYLNACTVMYINIVLDFVLNNIDDNNNIRVFIYFIMSIIFLNVIMIVIMITYKSNRN